MDSFFSLFRRPNIEKMTAARDINGLYRVLQEGDDVNRLRAADALARLGDGAGWRYLIEALKPTQDPSVQAAAAGLLAELGGLGPSDARRARTALTDALSEAKQETRGPIRAALAEIDSIERESDEEQVTPYPRVEWEEDQPEPHAKYPPGIVERIVMGEGVPMPEVVESSLSMPQTSEIQFLSAETHLNTAVELREAELEERALVETGLALWIQPSWGYAHYLRGVLYEELERPVEAALSYRAAVRLDTLQRDDPEADARGALAELEAEAEDEGYAGRMEDPLPDDLPHLLADLTSRDWKTRRDTAALLGALASAHPALSGEVLPALLPLLDDEEREARHAALAAVASIAQAARPPVDPEITHQISQHRESSWLLRFTILDALSALGDAHALRAVLLREMEGMADSVFHAQRDPLHEVEYERMMETGALAFLRSGDLEGLVEIAEGNEWVEEGEEDAPAFANQPGEDDLLDDFDEPDDHDDLTSYVDEVSLMACAALDRLASRQIADIPNNLLRRISVLPDLTLLDYSETEDGSEPQQALAYDFSPVRAAALAELDRRERAG